MLVQVDFSINERLADRTLEAYLGAPGRQGRGRRGRRGQGRRVALLHVGFQAVGPRRDEVAELAHVPAKHGMEISE